MVISTAGFAVAAGLVVVAVVLFFKMNVRGAYGIVTGKTASKNIRKVWDKDRVKEENTGEFEFFTHRQNAEGVKSAEIAPAMKYTFDLDELDPADAMGPAGFQGAGMTELLTDSDIGGTIGRTELLRCGGTQGETAILDYGGMQGETAAPDMAPGGEQNPVGGFRITRRETAIHVGMAFDHNHTDR
jgi:hypothetical protein